MVGTLYTVTWTGLELTLSSELVACMWYHVISYVSRDLRTELFVKIKKESEKNVKSCL